MRNILFIDTETGGLDPARHSLLQVGWAGVADGKIVLSGSCFISQLEYTTTPQAMSVNGLDLAQVRDEGISHIEAAQTLFEQIRKLKNGPPPRIGGHNTQFDLGFITHHLGINLMDYAYRDTVDTKVIASFLRDVGLISPDSLSLGNLYQYLFNKPLVGAHGAEADARATAEVYLELLKCVGEKS